MTNQIFQPHKSSIGGMDANVMALLTYIASVVIGWIPGLRYFAWLVPLILFLIEKESNFVKFHAMQAFILHIVEAILTFIISVVIGGIVSVSLLHSYSAYSALGIISFIGILVTVIAIVITVFAIIAMINAYSYKAYHIPFVGDLAAKISGIDK